MGNVAAGLNTNAFLEPVLQDGLRCLEAGDRFRKTPAASRSFSPAVIRASREIFSVPRFEEIFDGHFRRDSARFQGPLETHAVAFFRDASLVRPVQSICAGSAEKKYSRAGFLCRTGSATTIDCRKRGWP